MRRWPRRINRRALRTEYRAIEEALDADAFGRCSRVIQCAQSVSSSGARLL